MNKKVIPILLFIFVFSLYLYTAPRGETNFADSNELIAASYTSGIPHPPGYPLFLIIGKLFSYLPFGEIAFRYSIFAALFSALTVMLVYLTIIKVINQKKAWLLIISGLIGALSLAFSYVFWLYSIVPDVFVLLNFFTALLIYLMISWNKVNPFLIALIFTLGFLSQQLIVFLIPALLYFIFVIDRHLLTPSKKWLKIFLGFIIGLSPLIYFPLAALRLPVIDYGNPTSFQRIWDYITRKIYARGSHLASAYLPAEFDWKEKIVNGFNYYLTYIVEQFGLLVLLIGVFALCFIIFKRQRKPEIFLALAFIFAGPLLSIYIAFEPESVGYNLMGAHERMFIMGSVAFSYLIGIGASNILNLVKKSKIFSVPIVALFLLFLCSLLLVTNFKIVNKKDFTLGEELAHDLFINMEPNAIFFTRGDMPSFSAYYYKYVKGERKDVTIVPFSLKDWAVERLHEQEPDLWDTDSKRLLLIFRDIIQKNIDKRPIYFTGIPGDNLREFGLSGNPFYLSPRGLLTQVTKEFDPQENIDFWEKMNWDFSRNISDYYDWFAKEIFEQYAIGSYNTFAHYQEQGYYDLANQEIKRLISIDPKHPNVAKAYKMHRLTGKKEREIVENREDYMKQGYEYINKRKPGSAAACFSLAKELAPNDIIPRLQLAKSFEMMSWWPEAVEEYKGILELDPGNKEAVERLIVVQEQ